MVSAFMISRRHLAALFVVPALAFAIEAACNRVPLLAPSGSSITLTTATSILPVSGSATIIAQVVESAGTAPQAGTHVTFTTSLGTIQPNDATTDSSGRATAVFTSTTSGTATITAISGGATTGANGALKILVGAAGVQKVVVNASPATVPALGGSSTISATVFDVNGSLMASIPVTFTTTAGTLSSGVVNTDATGIASTTLTTAQTSTVTANVGVGNSSSPTTSTPTTGTPSTGTPTTTTPAASGQASGSVTVNISTAPTLVITPPTTAPTAGNVATFTFAVTAAAGANGSAIRNLNVDWGDGNQQDLGAVTGNATVVHTYTSSGTFVITATVSDAAGNATKVSTIVFVQVAPPLSVGVSASASISGANTIESFTATVTGLGNSVAQNYHWVFGDNTTADTSTNQTSHTYVTGSGAKNVSVTVTTSTGAQATGTVVVVP